ncbi:hypothetical protein [Nannocystis punicea]|uniref:WD40-like Beta Propeller Repeat n=1 Tax=Nannocystis punicea TaxID=2995304 RepID=A0ABY7GUV3_9BACT|nr:hypothetical protein [Nannocystis poenicansa]WAS90748.1 hypothetical protein O0S08_31560 [Nannocystis poenicansa]
MPTSGESMTTGEPTGSTTDSTTGEPALPGTRVVYSTLAPARELYFVDCTGETPGAPVRIHEPNEEGWLVTTVFQFSPSGRWLQYNRFHETLGREAWLVDMSGPMPGVPKRVELPQGVDELGTILFSHDESKLALRAADPGGGFQFHVCTIEPDGTCVPESWGVPLQPGGTHRRSFEFSPDDTRVTYFGDPDGDGLNQVFLGGTAPGDAGVAVAVSGDLPPVDDTEVAWFSQDGATLYYTFGPTPDRQGVRAVDITSDPPGDPKTVVPNEGRFEFRADESAVLWWSSEGSASSGDLAVFVIDGTKVGPSAPIHDEPGRVSDRVFEWSADGRFALYRANGGVVEDAWALFASDLSGPTPAPPVRLSAPITTNGTVDRVLVGPDPSFVLYTGWPDLETGHQLWKVPLESPGDRVLLAETSNIGTILEVVLGPEGSQVIFASASELAGEHDLFFVDASAPAAPVKLNAPLKAGEGVARLAFSHDGRRVFYNARKAVDDATVQRLLQVEVDEPGAAVQVSAPEHSVGLALFLPPVGE